MMASTRNYLFGLSAQEGEELMNIDIKDAYPHAPVPDGKIIYVHQPPGLEKLPANAPKDHAPKDYVMQVLQAFKMVSAQQGGISLTT